MPPELEKQLIPLVRQLDNNAFFGHGADNAWDEIIYLTLYLLGLPAHEPLSSLPESLDPHNLARLQNLIKRRIQERIPVAYLTHEAWFCGLPFYVDERVLIPRSPIAELIADRFNPWLTHPPRKILELCTGSGCIALACCKAFPEAEIIATDIDSGALDVARINCHNLDTRHQLQLVQADLFRGLSACADFDLIIANPPYVSTEEMAELPPEYHHEPTHALHSPASGLAHMIQIIELARGFLRPGGLLVGEVGHTRQTLMRHYPRLPFMWPEFEFGGDGVFLLMAEDCPVQIGT
ncbi:MAG: 50S ribosomal protein L3 N(5)-glutamine methyltransferase [Gammaproteobacteria bacterium]|nr:MAG: 50S ribosomal protein L3 N(5)-glutamine methyltransferase [Gammaproteobacteria bacterium]